MQGPTIDLLQVFLH